MKCTRCQGDPAIKITEDGAIMHFISGQPVMDTGFENAVQISLFTRPGWWGNVLFKKQSEKIGSNFETECLKPIQNIISINNIEDAAKNALKWMTDENIATTEISVTNPKADMIKTEIKIIPSGKDINELSFLKNGINWILQASDPAHDKFPEVI